MLPADQNLENAARNLQFEKAAAIRDKIKEIKETNHWEDIKVSRELPGKARKAIRNAKDKKHDK